MVTLRLKESPLGVLFGVPVGGVKTGAGFRWF